MGKQWVRRWCMWMAPTPSLPGVWRRRDGGFVVRARVKHPKTGRLVPILRALPEARTPSQALAELEREKARVRSGAEGTEPGASKPRFHSYAASLMETKIASLEIESESGSEKWAGALEHLFRAPFAEYFIDKIRYADLKQWRATLPALTWKKRRTRREIDEATGKKVVLVEFEILPYSNTTLNTWLRVLRTICAEMTKEFELDKNPCDGLELFPEDSPYTDEQPNALNEEGEVAKFLAKMDELYPQHYAQTALGFCIGHRPSTLRPLTRKGPDPDWTVNDEGTSRLRVRKSNSRGQEVMKRTKNRQVIIIDLPVSVTEMLQEHVAKLDECAITRTSDLLFPSTRTGRIQSRTTLAKPFAVVASAIGLKKKITPKAMRRSYKDIARAADIPAAVRKGVSGHKTDVMDAHYASPSLAEKSRAVAKVFDLAKARARRASAGS